MKKTILLILLISLSYGSKPFDRTEKILFASYTILHLIDIGQTNNFLKSDKAVELNPILGKKPSMLTLSVMFIISKGFHLTLLKLIESRDVRKIALTCLNLVEIYAMANNSKFVGLKTSFKF